MSSLSSQYKDNGKALNNSKVNFNIYDFGLLKDCTRSFVYSVL
jgi:hypothetical protein